MQKPNIDENMGLLMKKLDEWKLADSTLLIYMTDNGTAGGSSIYNAGMKGGKGSVTRGGSRVPLFMRLPGYAKEGMDIDKLTRHIDLFPTLVEIAGIKMPSELKLDGRSLVPLIQNPDTEWNERLQFFHKGRWKKNPDFQKFKSFSVRNEKWLLVNNSL